MLASTHILNAIAVVEQTSSPWKPDLIKELSQILNATRIHESWEYNMPRQTSLGHSANGVVDAHAMATDAGLAILDCND